MKDIYLTAHVILEPRNHFDEHSKVLDKAIQEAEWKKKLCEHVFELNQLLYFASLWTCTNLKIFKVAFRMPVLDLDKTMMTP